MCNLSISGRFYYVAAAQNAKARETTICKSGIAAFLNKKIYMGNGQL